MMLQMLSPQLASQASLDPDPQEGHIPNSIRHRPVMQKAASNTDTKAPFKWNQHPELAIGMHQQRCFILSAEAT